MIDDRIVQSADRPPGRQPCSAPQVNARRSEKACDYGQDRRLHRSVDDAPATGTERHPDAEFFEPARHQSPDDTVEPDDCEHQRKNRKAEQKQRHEPLPGPTRVRKRVFRRAAPGRSLVDWDRRSAPPPESTGSSTVDRDSSAGSTSRASLNMSVYGT